jgi:uncharacterized protein YdiU (UPF0061 family)
MNTDNMSILGLTIDYGPYGWIDNFDPGWTPNTTDAQGRRYCFGRQPQIARWNLERLGDALFGLLPREAVDAGLNAYNDVYDESIARIMAAKFGLPVLTTEDADLVEEVFALMQQAEVDMTDFFRRLATVDIDQPEATHLQGAFYGEDLYARYCEALGEWLDRYAARLRRYGTAPTERAARMNAVNPRFVLRNYLAQQAIERAEQGDPALIHELLDVLRRPYDEQPGREAFSAKRPDWARHQAGCSMLSCSS